MGFWEFPQQLANIHKSGMNFDYQRGEIVILIEDNLDIIIHIIVYGFVLNQ